MSDPWKVDQPIKEENIINESERDSANPENDEYKVVKLEDNGKFSEAFIRDRQEFTFDESGTFTVPDWGDELIVEAWGAGASGGAVGFTSTSSNGVASGGSAGEYARLLLNKRIFNSGDTIPVVIGEGGGAVTSSGAATGSNGGQTKFGEFVIVNGGNGGQTSAGDLIDRSVSNRSGNRSASTNDDDILPTIIENARGSFGGGASVLWSENIASATDGESGDILPGGGGGAAKRTTTSGAAGLGGASVLAGKGGNGAFSLTTSVTASNGESPGGGGGAAVGRGGATSGAGASGRVKVTVLSRIGT